MKKTLSILLALTMLLTSCMLLASCGKVNEKDIEKDPYTALNNAWQDTAGSFFTEDKETSKVLENAAKKGKFTVTFDGGSLLGEMFNVDDIKASASIHTDAKKQQTVADVSVNIAGEELAARVFADKTMIALSSPSILGSDTALAVYLDTFAEKLEGSALAKMLELDTETLAEVKKAVNEIKEALSADTKENEEDIKEFFNKLYTALKQTVAKEEVEVDGKKTEYIVASYKLNNETITAIYNLIMEELPEAARTEIKVALDEQIEDMNEDIAIDISVKVFVGSKSGALEKITLSGTAGDAEGEETVNLNATLTFSEKEIALHLEAGEGEEIYKIDLNLVKAETADKTTYTLTATMSTANVSAKLFEATYTHAKNGDLTLSIEIFEDETSTMKIAIGGTLKTEKDTVTLALKSLTMGEDTYTFNLTISVEAVDEIPAFPTDAKDIVTMTEEDWEAALTDMMEGPLGSLLGGGGTVMPDYDSAY